MSIDIACVFELIARRPRIRTIEIADIIDCDPEQVQPLLQPYINARTILLHLVTAPNGKPANGFEFSDAGKKTNEYRAVAHLAAPGVAIDGPAAARPAAVQLPATLTAEAVPVPQKPMEKRPASEALQALAKFPTTKVEAGIAFIKAHGRATPAQLQKAMGLKVRALVTPRTAPVQAVVLTPVDRPATFRCARWSDGTMEIERDGVSLAILSGAEMERMRHFMWGH